MAMIMFSKYSAAFHPSVLIILLSSLSISFNSNVMEVDKVDGRDSDKTASVKLQSFINPETHIELSNTTDTLPN
jgi:hypothetical protein